jgi:hypothetical protein
MKRKVKKVKVVKQEKKTEELYVNFVLDETGSMQVCREATISGFNEYVKTLEKKAKNVVLTLTQFNSAKVDTIFRAKKIKDVPELTDKTYQPSECTPLYDAIAKTIKDTEKEAKGKDVLCVIMTDGEENASKEYNRDKIFNLIKEKEKDKWVFVYLGANQDSWAVCQAIGLHKGNVINYATKNTTKAMRYAAQNTVAFACCSSSDRGLMGSSLLQDKDEAEKDLTA